MDDSARDAFLPHYDALRRLARRIVQDEHAAEDVVQDVWVAAQEARGVRARTGWLRAVTRHTALRTRARESRRRANEERSSGPDPDAADEHAARAEVRNLLLEALADLEEPYSTVLRARYLEERAFDEIATHTGCSPATVRSQARRGLARLRAELDRRHGGERSLWSTALLGALGRDGLRDAAPSDASSSTATGAARAVLSDARVWAGMVLVSLGVTVWLALRTGGHPRTAAVARAAESGPAARTDPEPARASDRERGPVLGEDDADEPAPEPTAERIIHLRVVDELGAPVPGARIDLGRPRGAPTAVGTTDGAGRFELVGPRRTRDTGDDDRHYGNYALGEACVGAAKAGMQCSDLAWFDWASAADQELELRLVRGAFRLAGRVVDPQGAGIGGVRVAVDGGMQRAPEPSGAFRLAPYSTTVESSADGSFAIDGLPPMALSLLADHPDHVLRSQRYRPEDWSTGRELEVVLERGLVLSGTVQDAALTPVAGAVVRLWSWDGAAPRTARTAADGSYRLAGVPRERVRLFASAGPPDGRATASTALAPNEGRVESARWDPVLLPAGDVRFELTDGEGEPLAGWRVQLATDARDWWAAVTSATDGRTEPLADWPREPLFLHVFRAGPNEVFPVHAVDAWQPSAGTTRIVVDAAHAEPGELRGTLRTASGEPFTAVQVYLSSIATGLVTRCDVQPGTGDFAVGRLPAGEYAVIVSAPNGKAEVARVDLLPGERRDLGLLRAPAVGWLTVVDAPSSDAAPSYRIYADWPARVGVKALGLTAGRGIPARVELMAGPYAVEVSGGPRIPFVVQGGEEVVVRAAPSREEAPR